ncbi:hypothetical protein [Acutalibacter sp. 1XD8-36]|uniref:hypothetical protein n=1 Tax=Acutalibacter sp. 1XD8-36 TaxID=2320852 RepID=UPI0026317DC8|nr:hypothetical protein [Acutalibacter sp. 1XD8-36]
MITMMGSIGAYTKNLKLQTQFQMKQARGELGSHKSLDGYLSARLSEDGEDEHKPNDKLRDIHNKLLQGGKLTPEERKYLQAKDPEAYQKLKAAELEQKAFEQKLKQCRTKEEAQRLKMTYINSSLVTLKGVEHNSSIPKDKKLEIFMQEKQRCDRIEESSREFVSRGDHNRLPTEAEEHKAIKDSVEAEEAQKPGDTPDPVGKPEEKKLAVHVETEEEKKVKRARANSRRGSDAEFHQAVAAYAASAAGEAGTFIINTKG